MRKLIMAGAAAMTTLMLLGGGVAAAGEVTGNGKETPIKARQSFPDAPAGPAGSFCAFSGQNDQPTGNPDPLEDGRVQSWGDLVQEFARTFGGVSEFTDVIHAEGPGTSCRGFASQG
jgi:hypothetical protein